MLVISDVIRGYTESIILSLLYEQDSYGYEINKVIQETTNHEYELKEATLYSAFRRLEAGGFISSYWGDQTTGARRRYYTITKLGKQLYIENYKDWRRAKSMIDQLLKNVEGGNTDE